LTLIWIDESKQKNISKILSFKIALRVSNCRTDNSSQEKKQRSFKSVNFTNPLKWRGGIMNHSFGYFWSRFQCTTRAFKTRILKKANVNDLERTCIMRKYLIRYILMFVSKKESPQYEFHYMNKILLDKLLEILLKSTI